jgi:hypothetical protein
VTRRYPGIRVAAIPGHPARVALGLIAVESPRCPTVACFVSLATLPVCNMRHFMLESSLRHALTEARFHVLHQHSASAIVSCAKSARETRVWVPRTASGTRGGLAAGENRASL